METDILSVGERYFREERTAVFRKEEYTYIHTGIIDGAGETWTTTELDEANIFQVYNQYREKHGIPFPDEISGIRRHYGMSAAKMSQILGFGINQYRLYEEGEVPSISNARTIVAAKKKDVFMSFIEASKAEMSDSEYRRLKNKAESAAGDFAISAVPSVYSGYRSLSSGKISAAIDMIMPVGGISVSKMNKLLFYADFINYRRHGYGITGIAYHALPSGPVPDSWPLLYGTLSGVKLEESVYPDGNVGIMLRKETPSESDTLNGQEVRTIEYVCARFSGLNERELMTVCHKEKAWTEGRKNASGISYRWAFELYGR